MENIKTGLREIGRKGEFDSLGSGYCGMADPFKHYNNIFDPTKADNFFDQLINYPFTKIIFIIKTVVN
jgi:hypothetical protein